MTTRTQGTARAHYHHLATTLRDLESDLRWGMEGSARIPPEWHAIAQGVPAPRKVPVTMRLDEDVAKFFRSMGAGHLPRMNGVLRAFMHARLAGVVKGAEDVTYAPSPEELRHAEMRRRVEETRAKMEAEESGMTEVQKRKAKVEAARAARKGGPAVA
jgi:uncharacterized protein (DUF4415 family)